MGSMVNRVSNIIYQLFLGPLCASASWAFHSETMRARGKTVLVKFNQQVKLKKIFIHFSVKIGRESESAAIVLTFKAGVFRYQQPTSSSANQNAALIIDHQLNFTKFYNQFFDYCYSFFLRLKCLWNKRAACISDYFTTNSQYVVFVV